MSDSALGIGMHDFCTSHGIKSLNGDSMGIRLSLLN